MSGRLERRVDGSLTFDVDREGDAAELRGRFRAEPRIPRERFAVEQAQIGVRRPEPADLVADGSRELPPERLENAFDLATSSTPRVTMLIRAGTLT